MRPTAITVTTVLMAFLNLLGYALLLDLPRTRTTVVVEFATLTLFIAAGYVVLWFYWQGRNWARILVFFTCFLCFYNLRSFTSANLIVKIMLFGEAAVAAFLVYWLNTVQAKAFFKDAAVHP
jgi:hypothetical protein